MRTHLIITKINISKSNDSEVFKILSPSINKSLYINYLYMYAFLILMNIIDLYYYILILLLYNNLGNIVYNAMLYVYYIKSLVIYIFKI